MDGHYVGWAKFFLAHQRPVRFSKTGMIVLNFLTVLEKERGQARINFEKIKEIRLK